VRPARARRRHDRRGARGGGGSPGRGPRLVDRSAPIVSAHHGYLRSELPRLSTLLAKVERAHAQEQPELARVRTVFEQLRAELEPHLAHEEEDLFPALLAGERADVTAYEAEHARAGSLLEQLAELTGGYDLGRSLCNTHRAALDALAALQRDVHEHVHEENNILFPRALTRA
jgi:regulator of cell morphogenesis and NO signaling